jgi:DNA-binding MarR family transcriptional regulator
VKASESKYCNCIYWASAALARKVNKVAEDAWAPIGLAPGQAYLLSLILDTPGRQPLDLSEELHLAPSTITRFIEKLEENKLVIRISEGKTTSVYPTQKAKGMIEEINSCRATFKRALEDVLPGAEKEILVKNMLQVADKLGS